MIDGASEIGYKSIGVQDPSRHGLAEKKYGKLTLKQVMAPAIRLAREGYGLTQERSARSAGRHLEPVPRVAADISTRRQLLPAGRDFPAARYGAVR